MLLLELPLVVLSDHNSLLIFLLYFSDVISGNESGGGSENNSPSVSYQFSLYQGKVSLMHMQIVKEP